MLAAIIIYLMSDDLAWRLRIQTAAAGSRRCRKIGGASQAFNFYPLTAVMIVMLALLNDGAILSIAYDNVHYKDQPEAWNMHMVLGISTVLGVLGPIAAFGLFYLGDRVYHLDVIRGRTSDDFFDAHARPLLVHTPRKDITDRGVRHTNRGDVSGTNPDLGSNDLFRPAKGAQIENLRVTHFF